MEPYHQIHILVAALVLLTAVVQLATCTHNLEEEYRFSAILDEGYTLHWNFDLELQTIDFAVNVSTTGWVGFGLSPNGQMPQSDVVIGWVDNNGNTQFDDRFAINRYLPPVDKSQDWCLVSGEEENGHTILEFTRKLTTCDDNDLTIKADTSRVIWAYHSSDPSSDNSLKNLRHEKMGSVSLNLLGGNNEDRVEPNTDFFILNNDNLSIPSDDTTYWCSVRYLPDNIRQEEKYIYKIAPALSEASKQFVHHIVVYLCSNDPSILSFIGRGTTCTDLTVTVSTRNPISVCRVTEVVIAAWAIGGQEFVFPRDVAYPIGGRGNREIVILEIHYNNPKGHKGVLDSSGLKFTYTSVPPRHRAAILTTGFTTDFTMVIPPEREKYVINSVCSDTCTKQFFPPEGITVFGNLLHTHLKGHGVVVRHFRKNECGLQELEPIDENKRYDFNYQQVTLLPKPVKVLPGDTLQIQCFYRTTGTSNVTLGGESTREEMCLSFLLYYPASDLGICTSKTTNTALRNFSQQYIDRLQQEHFLYGDRDAFQAILDQVEWTDEASARLEGLIGSNATIYCTNSNDRQNSLSNNVTMPSADCSYEHVDECTGKEPQSRCPTGASGAPPQAGVYWLPYTLICALSVAALALL